MSTDATRSNAEQWHIQPQCDRKLAELESDTARRQLEAYQAKQLDTQRGRLGDGMAPQPQQPTVIATHVVDLRPLVEWWQSQEQRLRDQVAVERTAASSAREALAACEERVRQANAARDLALTELDESRDSYASCEERLKAMTAKAEEWRAQTSALVKRNSKARKHKEVRRATRVAKRERARAARAMEI